MAWPFTPLTTYVQNSVPAIQASDLNALQTEANFQSARGLSGINIQDDFITSSLSSVWALTTSGTSSTAVAADDSANGGSGALSTSSSSIFSYNLATPNINIGANDFRIFVRYRGGGVGVVTYTLTNSGSGGTNSVVVTANTSTGSLVVDGTNYNVLPAFGAYNNVLLVRTQGLLTVYANGSQSGQVTYGTNMGICTFAVRHSAASAATSTCLTDVASLNVYRY